MNALFIIQLVITLLQGVAAAANNSGLTLVAAAAQNAIKELLAVHDSEITKGQLDSLEVKPQW